MATGIKSKDHIHAVGVLVYICMKSTQPQLYPRDAAASYSPVQVGPPADTVR
jgi:hypothetical protein